MKRTVVRTNSIMRGRVFHKIMLAFDGSEESARAADVAMDMAALNHADLVITHVATPTRPILSTSGFGVPVTFLSGYYEESLEEIRQRISGLVATAERYGIKARSALVFSAESVAEEVTHRADREGVDLIVTGTSSPGPLKRLLQGSVSADVLKHANCPVLVVR